MRKALPSNTDNELQQRAKKYARQFKNGRSLASLQHYAFEDFLAGARAAKEIIGKTKPERCENTLEEIEAVIAWMKTQQMEIAGTIVANVIVDETISHLEECLKENYPAMTGEPQQAT